MPAHLIDLAQLPATPWKNGGGSTRQLAIAPPGAGLDDFSWRISCAQVASSGAFSHFPGVDRSLALLTGSGLELQRAGARHTLHADGEVLVFGGEEDVAAQLIEGPVTDLNVMTRRGLWRHQLRHLQLSGTQTPDLRAELVLIYCLRGTLLVQLPAKTLALGEGQGLLLENEPCPEALHSEATAGLYIACFHRQA